MTTTELLLAFSKEVGISGRENFAHSFAKKQLEPYGTVTITPTNSLICTVKKPKENGIHIMLDAHLDEVGMIVRYIGDDGFIRIAEVNGVDERLLFSYPVDIHTKDGILTGIICSIPPHLSTGERKNPKPDEIYIDTGLSGEEAKKKIRIGDMITFQSYPAELLGGHVRGKSLDDRAGCATLLKALEYLDGDSDCGLSVVFSSMEEIGGMGARTATYELHPTHALAVDVSFALTPDADKMKCGEMGKGPMIGYAPILKLEISRRLEELAEENKIPYQTEVMGSGTGTNCDSIVIAHTGVKTALLSVPQRFMHTPNEVVNVEDVENTAKLIVAWIKDLSKEGK